LIEIEDQQGKKVMRPWTKKGSDQGKEDGSTPKKGRKKEEGKKYTWGDEGQ